MKIISMAYTTPAFVNRAKTVTRRSWTPQHAVKFHKGDLVRAYSKSPQWKGEPIGVLKLTETPYREKTGEHLNLEKAQAFYKAEGFKYLDDQYAFLMLDEPPLWPLTIKWIEANTEHWVVPFEIVEVEPGAVEKFSQTADIVGCVRKLCEVLA